LLPKAENGQESFVDTPLLCWRHVSDEIAEAACVYGPDLLDKDASGLT
jgi:hypothetical protein